MGEKKNKNVKEPEKVFNPESTIHGSHLEFMYGVCLGYTGLFGIVIFDILAVLCNSTSIVFDILGCVAVMIICVMLSKVYKITDFTNKMWLGLFAAFFLNSFMSSIIVVLIGV